MNLRITSAFGLLLLSACASTKGGASSSGLVLSEMDLSADPAKDFYRYVNGGWLDANPVPADEASWGVFHEVDKRNQAVLREILEEATRAPKDDLHRMLGDYFATGMDEAAIEKHGLAPIQDELAAIDGLSDVAGMPSLLARLHPLGCSGPFGISVFADLSDAAMNLLYLAQDGMGLPEKDYYLRGDEESVALRKEYQAHIARMLALLGDGMSEAHAATILALETALATKSFGAVDFRDPQNLANKISMSDLQALTPHFDWTKYLTALGHDALQPVNPIAPDYFRALHAELAGRPLDDWKVYLRWRLITGQAPFLTRALEEEDFAFFGRTLGGAQEQRPRWKRVVDATGGALGEALGQAFVARTFSPKAKERCQQMVGDLLAAFRARLEKLEWMSDETRTKALGKLATFATKIGYPDTWRDWSGLKLGRDSYAQNHMRAAAFEFHYNLAKAGKPVDKQEWGMPAYEVNAGYNPTNNDITFPAGILQPPFFSENYDDALNYGAMGAVIGHEITHGFDDEGSQFDAQGNLANWWTESDRAEFERRAKVVEEQFNGYEALPGLNVNGKLTLGENMADFAGLTIAHDALNARLANQRVAPLDGFTPSQRLFIAWARAWRNNYTPERLKLQVNTNPHAPAQFRAIGPLSNMDAFQAAFGFAEGAPVMRKPGERAKVW
jgi:putative endopeptidase